jgi:glycine/D-amino acid oxidase-like deaminating enzyme
MTVVGLGFKVTAQLRGKAFLKDAHRYMERAVDAMDELILREQLDCRRLRPGFPACGNHPGLYSQTERRDRADGGAWLQRHPLAGAGRSTAASTLRALPGRNVRRAPAAGRSHAPGPGRKRLAQNVGVEIYENTPVLEVSEKSPYILRTPSGSLQAEKLVYAVNAYSHLLPPLGRKQFPAFTYMIATEPLTAGQLEQIGWEGFEGLEDARNLIHYYRLTADQRIVIGGGPVGLKYRGLLDNDSDPNVWPTWSATSTSSSPT